MQVALVGLTQSGKSTLFSAISGTPFESNVGAAQIEKTIVKVPDSRLGILAKIYKPKKITNATIEFLDIPGISFLDDAGKRQARQLLAQARQADMLVAVLRAFKNDSVATYNNRIDPSDDFEQIQSEMLMGDMEMVSNRIEKLEKSSSKPSKTQEQDKRELDLMRRCMARLENLEGLDGVVENPEEEKMVKSFGFLTMKPLCVVINTDEDKTSQELDFKLDTKAEIIQLSATLEAELAMLDDEDRSVFMQDMGITEIARERLVKSCYDTVKLISFLTVGEDEVRAWTIPVGCLAPIAGGVIHSDIERGFIRAETVAYDDFMGTGDMKGAKAAGKVRLEGKTYPVQDGDIINFRFNV